MSTDADGNSKQNPEADTDRGPVYAEYRLGDDTHEIPYPTWAVMPTNEPDDDLVWLDLIGHDTGEWSAKFTPEQARQIAEALQAAAGSEDA